MRTDSTDRIIATVAAATGLLALGILSIRFGDLLLQWQPAPKAAAWRAPAAYLSGAILLTAGVGLLIPRARSLSALLATAWITLWVVALNVPVAMASGGNVAALLGVAESAAMAIGFGTLAARPGSRHALRLLAAAFGACAIVFGISHFVYADFTSKMVPAWIPMPLVVAYVTGAVHALTGLALLIGIAARWAAVVEAAMMTAFVVLLHLPHVAERPHDRLELTMLAIAWTLASAAWLVATTLRRSSRAQAT